MMNEPKPWFVTITGPMQWQLKPYAWQGWAVMSVWAVAILGVMALLLLETVREQWWIVPLLAMAVTVPLILIVIQNSVPIDELRSGRQRRRGRARGGRERGG
jgi:hypothetical protein